MNNNIPPLNTSIDAYLFLRPGRVRWCVYHLIAEYAGPHGLTHDDIERLYMRGVARNRYQLATESGIRSRTAELVQAGLVERVPNEIGRSRTGRKTALWRLTPAAQLLEALPPQLDGSPDDTDPAAETALPQRSDGNNGPDTSPDRTGTATSKPTRETARPAHHCDGQQELFDLPNGAHPVDNSR